MSWIQIFVASFVLLIGTGSVLIQIAGLPGTWLILLLAVAVKVVETVMPLGTNEMLGWWTIVGLIGLAIVGELVEFVAAAVGAKTGGASKRGMVGAVVGSLIGALVCTFLILIPVVGTLVGAAVGAALGAVVGELSGGGKQLRDTALPAAGALVGRLGGLLAKTTVAGAMLVLLGVALVV
jgi:uncharacterized protein YqgC (DUF456 family)